MSAAACRKDKFDTEVKRTTQKDFFLLVELVPFPHLELLTADQVVRRP